MKRAVIPGSFDPITKGHVDIILRALHLFDEVIVAIGVNVRKKSMFPLELRMKWISDTFSETERLKVAEYSGLTTEFCQSQNAGFIVRGLRDAGDFQFEKDIAQLNANLKGIETVCLISKPELSPISSSVVREIMLSGGDPATLIPSQVNWKEYI